ncbi:MAG TPA: chromate transporter [Chthonomonadaceae bacterium]|nr:chromate transporter [Chthonomonadaceae bacterium]
MNLLLYFALVLRASFFSTGGMGNVPALHDDLIARGWATEKIFAEGLAVGQVSPGPNGLWVVSLGYLLGGLRGAILSAIAICLPPLVILLLDRAYHRVKHHSAIVGFVRGLGLAVVGVFGVVLVGLLGGVGLDAASVAIALVSFVLGGSKRVPVIVILAGFAALGILLYGA